MRLVSNSFKMNGPQYWRLETLFFSFEPIVMTRCTTMLSTYMAAQHRQRLGKRINKMLVIGEVLVPSVSSHRKDFLENRASERSEGRYFYIYISISDKHNVKPTCRSVSALPVHFAHSHQQKTAAPVRSPSTPPSLLPLALCRSAPLHQLDVPCSRAYADREEGQEYSCRPTLSRAFASLVNSRSSQGS